MWLMACFVHYLAAYCASNLYALLNDYIIIKKCPAASAISKVRLYSRCVDVDFKTHEGVGLVPVNYNVHVNVYM